jgi:hypothetical protein
VLEPGSVYGPLPVALSALPSTFASMAAVAGVTPQTAADTAVVTLALLARRDRVDSTAAAK